MLPHMNNTSQNTVFIDPSNGNEWLLLSEFQQGLRQNVSCFFLEVSF